LAQLPAKLIKLFRRNVERNSHSAGMVPGITGKEWTRNERNGIDNAQIEHRHLPTLNLGVVNPSIPSSSTTTTIIDNTHPLSHPRHHHVVITFIDGRLPPHLLPKTSTARMTWQHHVTNRTSAGHIDDGMGDSGCHIAGCDVASTQRMTMMLSFVVVVSICTQCELLIPLRPNRHC